MGAIVDRFTSSESEATVEEVLTDLREARRTLTTDEECEAFLWAAGCYYNPPGVGETWLHWLAAVHARLSAAVR